MGLAPEIVGVYFFGSEHVRDIFFLLTGFERESTEGGLPQNNVNKLLFNRYPLVTFFKYWNESKDTAEVYTRGISRLTTVNTRKKLNAEVLELMNKM